MTEEQAVALAQSGWWKTLSARDIVQVQLFEPLLCMDFSDFHRAVEEALGRPVWTHEFADVERLRREFLGDRATPTMQEILDLIPADKRVVLLVKE